MKLFVSLLVFALTAGAARAEPPRVITDIAPVHALVSQVMGDLGGPQILIGPNADPHHFQMKPSQARALSTADIAIWVGPSLTPGLAGVIADADATSVALASDDHAHDEGHADPHAWLDPDAAIAWLDRIAEELSGADPENAETYMQNSRAAQDRLRALSAKIDARFATLEDRQIVVLHDAYDAFADRFGITIAAALTDSDAHSPSAARVADVDRLLKAGKIRCWFGEVGKSDALLIAVSEGTETRAGVLDPTGAQIPPGPALYETLIRQMADTIHSCLAGASG
ncbi:MAG: metal ABC transporter substrate-binding protein [Alphaproteobacteria bacterium]|nr:metal ABC transporter substrate-binding protein [Alphaproteobacteria bacterium]NNF24796.1 zinc ABC transporter solute-binding protein [Paracoccaceae bacterium]